MVINFKSASLYTYTVYASLFLSTGVFPFVTFTSIICLTFTEPSHDSKSCIRYLPAQDRHYIYQSLHPHLTYTCANIREFLESWCLNKFHFQHWRVSGSQIAGLMIMATQTARVLILPDLKRGGWEDSNCVDANPADNT